MSDDRTLEPSPRRLREARERGMVPHSPELTASVGILAAVAALGASGAPLIDGMLGLMQESLAGDAPGLADPQAFVHLVRSAIGAVAVPMLGVLVAPVLASLLAHQLQLGGLLVPSLAFPDPARLWPGSRSGSPVDRLGRALGTVLRAVVLIVLTWWIIRSLLGQFDLLAASSDRSMMLRSMAMALHRALLQLGLAMLVLGLIHYAVQFRRLHAQLRMTPEERREEQRSHDGDPSLRSRRRAARDRQLGPRQTEAASAADPI